MSDDNTPNITPRVNRVFQIALMEAHRLGNKSIGTEHLLLGIIKQKDSVAAQVLLKLGVDFDNLTDEITKAVGTAKKSTGVLPLTVRVKKVMALAEHEARRLGHNYIGTEHILLGLLKEGEGEGAMALKRMNINLEIATHEVLKCLGGDNAEFPFIVDNNEDSEEGEGDEFGGDSEENGGMAQGMQFKSKHGNKKRPSALQAFAVDLTEMAKQNKLDPVIGRETEMGRAMQILCRRTKNNPVFLGEAGVGKTAIVEGLAKKIASGEVPEILRKKKIFALDLPRMLAGTKYRGQFEERIKALMDEIVKIGNIIIFIDEIHNIVGAGSSGDGTMDAANILKPALSRGVFQCIGSTTPDEYRKCIEKDAALERRFQSIKVEPPSKLECVQILQGIRSKYEEHHKATITDGAIEAAVRLSDRYITDRFLPDKAIDVIDEAGSACRMAVEVRPPEFKAMEEEVQNATSAKEEAIAVQAFEEAAKYRDLARAKKELLDKKVAEWRAELDSKKVVVDTVEVCQVVSKWTGVPLTGIEQDEVRRLLSMEQELSSRVIGQMDAIRSISKALRRSRADLQDPNRPIGVFMLLGPTGVGKTLLSRVIAETMFSSSKALIQLDMSEYMEKFTVSRLVGSPPGYVGYDEGGQLTEKVRRRPYSVVLFDEIEKAHPDVWNILLQILEEGKLTDSTGRMVDFRNTIVLLTSNVGAETVRKNNVIGFCNANEAINAEIQKQKLIEEAKKVFRPEFLNRLDEILVFRSLNKEDLTAVLKLEMSKLEKRLEMKNITLSLEEAARDLLIAKGYDPVYGARPMRRTVEQMVQDPLAEEILRGHIRAGEVVKVGVDKGKLVFYQESVSQIIPKQQDIQEAVAGDGSTNIETAPIPNRKPKSSQGKHSKSGGETEE